MLYSEKITITMTLWTILALIISGNAGLDVFIVLILIGVLVLRELSDMFTSVSLKDRIDFFIYIGLIIFIGIVVEKIIAILHGA